MSTRTQVDHYTRLGVPPHASDAAITRAFRDLAKQLHPDASSDPARIEEFKDVTRAYEVLSDPATRREYDLERARRSSPGRAVTAARPRRPVRTEAQLRRRSHWMLAGGVCAVAAGVVAAVVTVQVRAADQAERRGKEEAVATPVVVDGVRHLAFETSSGQAVQVPEPERVEPGNRAEPVDVLYDPDDPTDVVVDENTFMRDITLGIVALKLVLGGAVLAWFGARGLPARRSAA